MRIIIEKPQPGEEEHIIIRCHHMRDDVLQLLSALNAQDSVLIAYGGNEIHRVNPLDVYYIETVDSKAFLYCKDNVFESKRKLYELEEKLSSRDFLRVSKSVIVNLNKIKSLRPAPSGRFEAVLQNGEKVAISRQYVSALKNILGI